MGRMRNANTVRAIRDRKVIVNNGSTLVGAVQFRGWGDLPDAYRADFLVTNRDVIYWVYSHDTPIAWIFGDLTVEMPPVDYSPTAATHQEVVAEALDIDFHVEESVRVGSGTAQPGVEPAPTCSTVRRRRAVAMPHGGGLG
jgi:hypothetical protein